MVRTLPVWKLVRAGGEVAERAPPLADRQQPVCVPRHRRGVPEHPLPPAVLAPGVPDEPAADDQDVALDVGARQEVKRAVGHRDRARPPGRRSGGSRGAAPAGPRTGCSRGRSRRPAPGSWPSRCRTRSARPRLPAAGRPRSSVSAGGASGSMTMTLSWARARRAPAPSRTSSGGERSHARLLPRRLLDPEPPHAAVEVGAVGLEHPRRLGDVALGLRQRRADEAPLEVVQRLARAAGPAEPEARRRGRPAAEHAADRRGVHRGAAEDAEPLDQVGQLAHVAGPASSRRAPRTRAGVNADRLARPHPLRQVGDERGQVLQPLPQRRQRDGEDVEPEEEVLPEVAGARPRPPAGGWWPTPPARRPGARSPRRCAAARRSPACGAAWPAPPALRSPISSRKSVPPCASSKRPMPPLGGAGEGAALVAEHLRLDQVARDRGAVHGDERAVGPAARARGPRRRPAPCRCPTRR